MQENMPNVRSAVRDHPAAAALFFYLLLYGVVTWPVVLSPAHLVACDKADGYFDMLLFWYARRGQFLSSHVDSLFHPAGVALGPEKAYWLIPLISVPLQWVMPLPAVFNLLTAAIFVATAWSVFSLAREQGARSAGAVLAGALFVLSPPYLNELSHGIPENMCVQWPVLFVLHALRLRAGEGRRDAVLAAIFYALSWFTSWYLGALSTVMLVALPVRRMAAPLAVALLCVALSVGWASSRGGVTVGRWDGASASALLTSPSSSRDSRGEPAEQGGGAVRFVASVVAMDADSQAAWGARQVVMNSCDPGGLFARYRLNRLRDVLPGLLLLGLATLGVWRASRLCSPLVNVALLFFLLSLGPVLSIGGHLICATPMEMFYRILPLLARLRPVRFMLAACLALSLMAAHSVPRLRSIVAAAALVCGLTALAWVEVALIHVAHYNIHPTNADIAASYADLADANAGAIIDLPLIPFDLAAGQHIYAQTRHGRPMLNYDFVSLSSLGRLGALARENSMVARLLGLNARVRRADVASLAAQGFGTLVVHTRVPSTRTSHADPILFDAEWLETLERVYGPPRVTPDDLRLFDMRGIRDACFSSAGDVKPGEMEHWAAHDDFQVRAQKGERRVLRALDPRVSSRSGLELCGWLSGRGGKVQVMQGARVVATVESASDDWCWVQIGVSPPSKTVPLRIVLEASSADGSDGCSAVELTLRALRGSARQTKGSTPVP